MNEPDLNQALRANESLIVEYLQENRDFFERNPQLLDTLKVSQAHKGVVSLVELQQHRQRDKIQALEQEISELMAVASHNERIYQVYVATLPRLLECDSFAELQHQLRQSLIEDLGVDDVGLVLNCDSFQELDANAVHCLSSDLIKRIRLTRLGEAPHYFGRLSQGEQNELFSESYGEGSVAIMPLGANAQFGFFVARSRDTDHYVAGMDSLLLTQLCEVLASLLPKLLVPQEQSKRAKLR
ncbi:DUF484 family protein [Alginatibacterium sediminis]|uniref:DUF484 family protein n=1 Tax=Alginatibacterium sediminis TaxID=2164068 RepID=A0A420ENC2_9ALTE|nr:DUF484 family protein [Alginatibacterium sediminis]RKF22096.1 DUF484 family protein [Alginatibacterium sediminis]